MTLANCHMLKRALPCACSHESHSFYMKPLVLDESERFTESERVTIIAINKIFIYCNNRNRCNDLVGWPDEQSTSPFFSSLKTISSVMSSIVAKLVHKCLPIAHIGFLRFVGALPS